MRSSPEQATVTSGPSGADSTEGRVSRWTFLVAGAVAFIVVLAHGAARSFVFDAHAYWLGNVDAASGHLSYVHDNLQLRSVLSAVAYLPAALVTRIAGSDAAGLSVLIENALLIAVLGALILPSLARRLVGIRPVHVWVSAGTSAVFLAGYAPYPLMDLWAVGLGFAGLLFLSFRSRIALVAGGTLLGFAVCLRPAYLAAVVIIALVWVILNWRRTVWPAIGIVVAFVPQTLVNVAAAHAWRPWPLGQSAIVGVQSQYSGYIVRYDTIGYVGNGNPQQFFCDPAMSAIVRGHSTPSLSALLETFLHHPGASIWLMIEKVAASLFWTANTPYSAPPGGGDPLSLEVLAISVVGLLALIAALIHSSRQTVSSSLPILAMWVGSIGTIAFSTPETRFALPLFLVGLVGVLRLIPASLPIGFTRTRVYWVAGSIALIALLVIAGVVGLSHPAAAGLASPAICLAH